jgi:SulP family sulfate permease
LLLRAVLSQWLARVRDPDAVTIERLEHFLREEDGHGVTILLAGVRPTR